jgi:hypothetical protein
MTRRGMNETIAREQASGTTSGSDVIYDAEVRKWVGCL